MRSPHIQYVKDTYRLKTDIQTILKMTGSMILNKNQANYTSKWRQ